MVVCLQRNRKIMLFSLQTSIQQRVRTDARGWVRVVYYIMWWCSSFAGEEDHDFESLGGGVGAEMAEEPNLRVEVSVAMRAGDAGGWTRLGIWTPFLSSLAIWSFSLMRLSSKASTPALTSERHAGRSTALASHVESGMSQRLRDYVILGIKLLNEWMLCRGV